jgi:transcriptional regulator with XRE-family HTH domain
VSREVAIDKVRNADAAAHTAAMSDPIIGIGQQLRDARLAIGLSLREMARRVDVSASFMSQLELGKTMPSVGTLYSIASELGVSLDDLMPSAQPAAVSEEGAEPETELDEEHGPAAQEPAARNRRGIPRHFGASPEAEAPVQRADRRHELRIGGAIWGRLTANHDPANDFLHVVYKPGGESCPPDQMIHHRGFEYGFIITGTLHVQVGFAHYDLGEGDSISFDSATPHRLSNPFDIESQSIWVVVGRGGTPVL